jgi:hypothetical protein
MDLGSGPPVPDEDGPLADLSRSAGTRPGRRTPSAAEPLVPQATHDDVDVGLGDWLDHPTLGKARVLEIEDDEHVTIGLESGRRVQLHLGLLHLLESESHPAGGRVFKVSIRRRR